MNARHRGQGPQPLDDPLDISRWTQIYAQHRSLGLVLFQVMFVLLSLGIALPFYYGAHAYRSGKLPLFWLCLAARRGWYSLHS